ncbi:AAA family ATPase [Ensifer sp. ENS10]|uniref:AAA family ATPase n=1 Tax=Ensifer sp. ENS10 TaxID=2769286 RepID=UPI00178334C7|nr:AAA family ATPase [Ensifer sp. ENS10]MBD9511663.1 AAA family ATPase [Ensifer sp. ENS10]
MSQAAEAGAAATASDDKITCHIDNVRVHSIQAHIEKNHKSDWTVARYQAEFPGEPLFSQTALDLIARKKAEAAAAAAVAEQTGAAPVANMATSVAAPAANKITVSTAFFHELFELGNAQAAMSSKGQPIPVKVLNGHDQLSADYLPEVDKSYVFNIDLLKKVIIGLELNMPTYLWGFHGTGKTTILQQAAAKTRRPFIRVQHTINMQESDVLGQWTVKSKPVEVEEIGPDGAIVKVQKQSSVTEYQLGPLPLAMINGWVYCADEYDFAMPSVTAVYQPVLEGQALLIKDAPPHFRKIVPHPNFRFVATGNTNGIGDETGLYQGTLVQNAANYSRFAITEEVEYMAASIETAILQSKTGIDAASAGKIVKMANEVRKMFRDGKITMTVSPRELIRCASLGIAYGGNWTLGMELAFANRLSRVDKKVVQEYMQRVFGAAA